MAKRWQPNKRDTTNCNVEKQFTVGVEKRVFEKKNEGNRVFLSKGVDFFRNCDII